MEGTRCCSQLQQAQGPQDNKPKAAGDYTLTLLYFLLPPLAGRSGTEGGCLALGPASAVHCTRAVHVDMRATRAHLERLTCKQQAYIGNPLSA